MDPLGYTPLHVGTDAQVGARMIGVAGTPTARPETEAPPLPFDPATHDAVVLELRLERLAQEVRALDMRFMEAIVRLAETRAHLTRTTASAQHLQVRVEALEAQGRAQAAQIAGLTQTLAARTWRGRWQRVLRWLRG